MEGSLNAYQRLVREVFLEHAARAATNHWGTPWDEESIGGNGHYVRALEAVSTCNDPDGAAQALSRLSDEIQDWAEANRQSDGWTDAALAMGWIRTSAARAWEVRTDVARAR